LRHVYQLRGYTVEGASDFRHLMVALAAAAGFDVVFALDIETAAALARDLAGSGSFACGGAAHFAELGWPEVETAQSSSDLGFSTKPSW
jgi:hypothetical protein